MASRKRGLRIKRFSIAVFLIIFVIAFIIFSVFFIRILSAFPDKPRVQTLFEKIDKLDIPFLERLVIGIRFAPLNLYQDPNLIGLWHFNGNSLDSSGKDNDGNIVGNVNCNAQGKFGKGCSFDGDGDYIDVSTVPYTAQDIRNNGLTYSLWFKTNYLPLDGSSWRRRFF